MKITQGKKKELRKKLIVAAVEVITEKGYHSATMREISAKAGLGAATIYKYFPSKEKLLYGYIDDTIVQVNEELNLIPDFNDFTLQEKLQSQIERLLGLYLNDREFVQEIYKLIFASPLLMNTFNEFAPIKDKFTNQAIIYLDEAIENQEIPEHQFTRFLANLYWDYTGMIIFYWLHDKSSNFDNTSQLLDMSLEVIIGVLKSGIVPKAADIITFLFRSHIYGNIGILQKFFTSNKLKNLFSDIGPSDEERKR